MSAPPKTECINKCVTSAMNSKLKKTSCSKVALKVIVDPSCSPHTTQIMAQLPGRAPTLKVIT